MKEGRKETCRKQGFQPNISAKMHPMLKKERKEGSEWKERKKGSEMEEGSEGGNYVKEMENARKERRYTHTRYYTCMCRHRKVHRLREGGGGVEM